ncbi:MAG: hypothetical protein AB7T06_04485 [Kofleriaceae bacterium]
MEDYLQLITSGEHARFREVAAKNGSAVWKAIQHCDSGQVFEALAPAFTEHASTPSPASRSIVLATLNGLIHPDPVALRSGDRRLAREREFPPERPPDARWFEPALLLFDDAELGSRAADLARCILVSVAEDVRRGLVDRCVELERLARWPRLYNALARSREARAVERLRAIAGGDGDGPIASRVRAASALIYEAGIDPGERDRLVGGILELLAQTDDAQAVESVIPVLEEHVSEAHRDQLAPALARWTEVAKREKATRYELPTSHLVKNALVGIAKDIGVPTAAPRRRRR